ncbi:TIGR02300 family protein [Pseudorhodobacter turbinis]|uniref:TIGR02300 family protein n=1 Tax=Pseudorhodobacter turbinis TaxID=2500533 RepID=A0A4P8EFN1_9RHOB|nr:TIGR02300 family protein [Pseudorhodobacter turbinis]QCO55920.1 TIGR02300 family protein [Pseudorhodobacter turbinis]
MPKEEWGTKRLCPTTGKRFYDLNKNPIVSPYTGEVVDIDSARRKIISTAASRPAAAKEDDEPLVDDLDADDDLLAVVETDDSDSAGDDLLEDDSDDTVSLDDLADVSNPDDDN